VNASHFGIQVATTQDVLEAKQKFEAASLPIRTEEEVTCCYAVQDKVWIEDPDGNSWEVFVVKQDAETMGETRSDVGAKQETACCGPGLCMPRKLADAAT
jgi:hypothetical protein